MKHFTQVLAAWWRLPLIKISTVVLGLVLSYSLILGYAYSQYQTRLQNSGSYQAGLLAKYPAQALVGVNGLTKILQPVVHSMAVKPVYILVTDPQNRVLQSFNPSNLKPEPLSIRDQASQWFGSRVLNSSNSTESYLEYSAPVLQDADLYAFVRIGYKHGLMAFLASHQTYIWLALLPAALLLMFMPLMLGGAHQLPGEAHYYADYEKLLTERDRRELAEIGEPKKQVQQTFEVLTGRCKQLHKERFTLHTSAKVLAYQKSKSDSILRSLPDAVMVLDETGCVTYVNKPFLLWYQLEHNQVVGKLPYQWCERANMLEFLARFRGRVARKVDTAELDHNPPGKPGAYIRTTAFPVFSSKDEKNINSTLLVFSDVTKETMAQQARDEFAAALAHELKTPLHAIGMYAESLMSDECEETQYRIEYADLIATEIEHVTDLVRNMLNITRIETGNLSINRKTTKLSDLINSVVTNLGSTADESSVKLINNVPTGLEPVYLDKDLLRIALNNLLSNAIKYNREGGEVKVEYVDDGAEMALVVSDTGIGISEADQEKIFDKFYRSEDELARAKQGNGLGLALAKEIIELHGGTMELQSTKGVGSEFSIKLKKVSVPLAEAA